MALSLILNAFGRSRYDSLSRSSARRGARPWGDRVRRGRSRDGFSACRSRCTLRSCGELRGSPSSCSLSISLLPEIGIRINEFWSGVVALGRQIIRRTRQRYFRLGLFAIPRGQMEAASVALGMPRFLAIRRVILPQAVRLVIPATANDFIALFKDTAVCSVIAVEELSKQYSMGAKSTGPFFEMAALASILYLLMSYPLSLLSAWARADAEGDGAELILKHADHFKSRQTLWRSRSAPRRVAAPRSRKGGSPYRPPPVRAKAPFCGARINGLESVRRGRNRSRGQAA